MIFNDSDEINTSSIIHDSSSFYNKQKERDHKLFYNRTVNHSECFIEWWNQFCFEREKNACPIANRNRDKRSYYLNG